MSNIDVERSKAREAFIQARKQARRHQLGAKLRGEGGQLLPFDAVRTELRLNNPMYRGIQEIPIAQIIGSVGRYREFTRDFLPLNDNLRDRWITVETLAASTGWPPIELYQVGDVYFVKDGNHRTAIARSMGLSTIEAHVWAFPKDLELDPSAPLDNILIQLGERSFESQTGLRELFPEHTIRFTAPGRYNELFAQIEALRQKLQIIDNEPKLFKDTVPFWYEMVYLPTVQIIHESGMMASFPGRTEADLFVWMSKHREQLADLYGDYDSLSDLAAILIDLYEESVLSKATRSVKRLVGVDTLPVLVEPEEARPQLAAEQQVIEPGIVDSAE
ncbi:MAG: transcriptional regulator [Anaerolineae bacterium]|nr:transcriptional regulator [Anaerolineae bacterium]